MKSLTASKPRRRSDRADLPRRASSKALRRRVGDGGERSMIERLPFVGLRPSSKQSKNRLPRDFWHNVKSTGDFTKDVKLGSLYASLALHAIQADRMTPLLGWIVIDMIENRCPPGVVVGFFRNVAQVCLGIKAIPEADADLARPAA